MRTPADHVPWYYRVIARMLYGGFLFVSLFFVADWIGGSIEADLVTFARVATAFALFISAIWIARRVDKIERRQLPVNPPATTPDDTSESN